MTKLSNFSSVSLLYGKKQAQISVWLIISGNFLMSKRWRKAISCYMKKDCFAGRRKYRSFSYNNGYFLTGIKLYTMFQLKCSLRRKLDK